MKWDEGNSNTLESILKKAEIDKTIKCDDLDELEYNRFCEVQGQQAKKPREHQFGSGARCKRR